MKKVEYIESSGGQYIDTAYIPKSNTKIVMRCNVQAQYAYPSVFGVRVNPGVQAFHYFARQNGNTNCIVAFATGEIILGQPSSVYNNDIEITLQPNNFNIKSIDDGTVLVNHNFTSGTNLSTTLSLYLFTLNENGHDYGQLTWTNMKLYSCEIYEGDTLVKSYQPSFDDEDVPCLYEKVNGETFYNAGSGVFTHGSVISPSKYLISSDGTYYTIQDGNLVELQISELSKQVFDDYGLDEVPQFEQISSLTNPSIYTWNAEYEPITTATMKATPIQQSIITNSIDLTHPSITGIEEAYAECEGDLIVAFSFDNKQTWKAWNGTEWALLTEDFTGMDKETLESITFEQWQEVYTGADTMHIRISLIDNTQAVEYVLVDFAN